MKIKIKYIHSEDYTYERVLVLKDDTEIGSMSTSADSPEDNNIGRLNVLSFVESLVKAINPDVEIENVIEEDNEE